MNAILKYLLLILLSSQTLIACAQKVDATDFEQQLKATPAAQLIDVRTPEEFANGHLENAQNINWNDKDFDNRVAELDKARTVFVYCQGGGRSAAAVARLQSLGFEKVLDMDGGIMAWRAAKLPEVTAAVIVDGGMSLEDYNKLLDNKALVLVDFYADWCIPCKKMKPFLEKMEKDKQLNLTVIRINADEHAALASELKVDGLPYLKLYRNQEAVWEHKGFIGESDLRKIIKEKKQ